MRGYWFNAGTSEGIVVPPTKGDTGYTGYGYTGYFGDLREPPGVWYHGTTMLDDISDFGVWYLPDGTQEKRSMGKINVNIAFTYAYIPVTEHLTEEQAKRRYSEQAKKLVDKDSQISGTGLIKQNTKYVSSVGSGRRNRKSVGLNLSEWLKTNTPVFLITRPMFSNVAPARGSAYIQTDSIFQIIDSIGVNVISYTSGVYFDHDYYTDYSLGEYAGGYIYGRFTFL